MHRQGIGKLGAFIGVFLVRNFKKESAPGMLLVAGERLWPATCSRWCSRARSPHLEEVSGRIKGRVVVERPQRRW